MVYLVPKYFQEHGVARRLHTRSLLIAINLVAGLSIFFFGYDQGMVPPTNAEKALGEQLADRLQVSWAA